MTLRLNIIFLLLKFDENMLSFVYYYDIGTYNYIEKYQYF